MERFFEEDEINRTVFQFTTQDYLTGKVKDTITKLRDNEIEFNELIIVTNRNVSTTRLSCIKQTARRDHGTRVDVFDYRTFHARLTDLSNGIFVRHFPNIDDQVALIKDRALLLGKPTSEAHEIAMLRTSCVLSFHELSHHARRNVFDNLTVAILSRASESKTPSDLASEYAKYVPGLTVLPDQVRASLERLHTRSLVVRKEEGYQAAKKISHEDAAAVARLNEGTESLLADVLDAVERLSISRLSEDDKRQVYANTRAALTALFRLSGLDLARQVDESKTFYVADAQRQEDLITEATKGLSNDLGESLVAVLADILSQPEADQAEILALWCRTFIGAQLMQLDPMLNEFQSARLSRKTFFLDTDTVLDAIVNDAPLSTTMLKLVERICSLGCEVIIPTPVIEECVDHAGHSERTYDYFGFSGVGFSAEVLEERVNNVFVKGYFYALQNSTIPRSTTYREYLTNYFEPDDPIGFFAGVVRTVLGDNIKIKKPAEILDGPFDAPFLDEVKEKLQEELTHSRKATYRTYAQTVALAETDAEIYAVVHQLNQSRGEAAKVKVLGENAYLVTSSRRYMRTAKALGIADRLTVLPKTLASLLERLVGVNLSNIEVVRLFENPFLAHAVEASWEDLKCLVKAGVDTSGKKLQRLRWDLEHKFHDHLTAPAEAATTISSESEGDLRSFAELVTTAKGLGYALVPEVESFMKEYEGLRADSNASLEELAHLKEEHEMLKRHIEEFGRRKRRYLRRVARGSANKPDSGDGK